MKNFTHVTVDEAFSGVYSVTSLDTSIHQSFGYANRSEQIHHDVTTRFGIASGCKLFTAIAICQLVERDRLSFSTSLESFQTLDLPYVSSQVTVHQLLTHTSGIPDYFDESVSDDFEALWRNVPMYRLRQLRDFLPLFQQKAMRNEPGSRFSYNNAGYILLGLIVEEVTGQSFTDYVEQSIFQPAGMSDSGYFSLDALPAKTALGYIDHKDGTWRTNQYAIPIKGGADGGAFVTVQDMTRFWQALLSHQLLDASSTARLLTPHVTVNDRGGSYGYGLWIQHHATGDIFKYHVMGYDPGVSFHSGYYPETDIISVVCANQSDGAFDVMKQIETQIGEKFE
ncbi:MULTISPECIES: serine hydrolase [Exiguobacterium]|uniref:serine hydrolase domain-containing protein n=1 Tax=Exiguobacterium sp. s124 TaxID=2751268 RepID=UPI0020369B2C|nr:MULTISPECIES: serine hydrolase [Exiguobacterium]MCT4786028.1 beta-lactamase family protein [Exiguobacterium aestuarii]